MLYNIINILEGLNFSFPLSPDKIVDSYKAIIGKSKTKDETPKKNKPNFTNYLYALLFVIIAFFTNGCPHEHPPNDGQIVAVKNEVSSQCLISYYKALSELITTEFETYFWKYSAVHGYKTMDDFSQEDFSKMKKEFWDIIEAKRMIILQMEHGDELIKKVEKIFKHKNFNSKFDVFIKEHQKDSLLNFSSNMTCYITKIQEDILDRVIHY